MFQLAIAYRRQFIRIFLFRSVATVIAYASRVPYRHFTFTKETNYSIIYS